MKTLIVMVLSCCILLNSTQLLLLMTHKGFNSKNIIYLKGKSYYCKK
jgi:hypothetical protein